MRKSLRYIFVNSWVAKLINGKFVQGVVPAVAMAYFLTLDVWGSDLRIVQKYLTDHKIICKRQPKRILHLSAMEVHSHELS